MNTTKPIVFLGGALDDLRNFPVNVRRQAGYQLEQVQQGREPQDGKPMSGIGAGVREIRIRDHAGAFRVIYLAKRAEAVYVLHCFQKTTRKTARTDLDIAARRFRDLPKEKTE